MRVACKRFNVCAVACSAQPCASALRNVRSRLMHCRYPPVRPLVLVLKYFLLQRRLNETYSGGVGSFLLVLMVVHVVQVEQRAALRRATDATSATAGARGRGPDPSIALNLGALLLSFLELFGYNLNYVTTGITVRTGPTGAGGGYFNKAKRHWADGARPFLLSVENPADPTADVGKNSWGIPRVRRAFAHAHTQLARCIRAWNADTGRRGGPTPPSSLLSSVIRCDNLLTLRAAELSASQQRDGDDDARANRASAVMKAAADESSDSSSSDESVSSGDDSRESVSSDSSGVGQQSVTGIRSVGAELMSGQPAAEAAMTGDATSDTAATAQARAMDLLSHSGVQLRNPSRLADFLTRRERGVTEIAPPTSWY